MLKIDAHAHIMPAGWASQKERTGYGGWIELHEQPNGNMKMVRDDGTFFREVEPNCYQPEAVIADMDANNVDVLVLCTIPVLFSYWAKPTDGAQWARFINDDLARTVANNPKRFLAMGTLPLQDIDASVKELERCCNELGMRAVEIGSNVNGANLDDPRFYPIWEAAQDLNMGIFVHPWEMLGGDRTKNYWGPWLVGMPAETTLAVTSMIFGGVFDKFPKLKVMFSHASGAFPFTLGRISHGYNCRPDLVNVNCVKDPREYVGKFWVDSITHDRDALAYLVSVMGADKIAYGTDYPFPLGDLEHGRMIEEHSGLDSGTKEQLFQSTVLKFLDIDAKQFVR